MHMTRDRPIAEGQMRSTYNHPKLKVWIPALHCVSSWFSPLTACELGRWCGYHHFHQGGGGEVDFKFLVVYHAKILSHVQMLTNNQEQRILVISSGIEKQQLRKGLSFIGEGRGEKGEKDRGEREFKKKLKNVSKRHDRRHIRRSKAWFQSHSGFFLIIIFFYFQFVFVLGTYLHACMSVCACVYVCVVYICVGMHVWMSEDNFGVLVHIGPSPLFETGSVLFLYP